MSKGVRVADLQDQTGKPSPRAVLHCYQCGCDYSANRGDYFALPGDHVFTCCGEPMTHAVRHETVVYEVVPES